MGANLRRLLTAASLLSLAALSSCSDSFDPGDPQSLITQAWNEFRLDEFDRADHKFASAAHWLEQNPSRSPADNRLLAAAYYGRGIVATLRRPGENKPEGHRLLQLAIQTDPAGELAPWAALAQIRDDHLPVLSNAPIDSPKLQTAYAQLEKTYAGTPAATEAFLFRISLLVKTLQPADAQTALTEIQTYLKSYEANPYRSALYMLQARAFETAQNYKMALLARIQAEQSKELDAANPNMDKALDYYQIALCAEYDVGDFKTARFYYNKFLHDYPVDQRAFIVTRELQRMDAIDAAGGDIAAAGDLGIRPPGPPNSGGLPKSHPEKSEPKNPKQ